MNNLKHNENNYNYNSENNTKKEEERNMKNITELIKDVNKADELNLSTKFMNEVKTWDVFLFYKYYRDHKDESNELQYAARTWVELHIVDNIKPESWDMVVELLKYVYAHTRSRKYEETIESILLDEIYSGRTAEARMLINEDAELAADESAAAQAADESSNQVDEYATILMDDIDDIRTTVADEINTAEAAEQEEEQAANKAAEQYAKYIAAIFNKAEETEEMKRMNEVDKYAEILSKEVEDVEEVKAVDARNEAARKARASVKFADILKEVEEEENEEDNNNMNNTEEAEATKGWRTFSAETWLNHEDREKYISANVSALEYENMLAEEDNPLRIYILKYLEDHKHSTIEHEYEKNNKLILTTYVMNVDDEFMNLVFDIETIFRIYKENNIIDRYSIPYVDTYKKGAEIILDTTKIIEANK